MILWLLAGCVHQPLPPAPAVERIDAFALQARGHKVLGQAVVVSEPASTSLVALTPAGTELFSVRLADGEAVVDSPQPELQGWLERMPFHRDLAVLYRVSCEDRCRGEGLRVRATEGGLRVSGVGGPVRLTEEEGRRVLTDRRRGYSLTVVEGVP